jgi:NAD(P)-dependent dehydrogenase (short-subunit alcohol dehydrogenase family)
MNDSSSHPVALVTGGAVRIGRSIVRQLGSRAGTSGGALAFIRERVILIVCRSAEQGVRKPDRPHVSHN